MRAADRKGFCSNLKRKLCGKLNNRFSVSLLPVRRGSLSTQLSAAIPEDVYLTYSYPDHSRIITPTELIKHNAAHSVFSAKWLPKTGLSWKTSSAQFVESAGLRRLNTISKRENPSFRTRTALGALMSRQSLGHARSNKQGGGGGGRVGGVTRPNAVVSPDGSFPPRRAGGWASVRPSG